MFTGLIQQRAPVGAIVKTGGGLDLEIGRPSDFTELKNGESIAVDGVCLTLTSYDDSKMKFFAGPETLAKTTLDKMKTGQAVNLERSLAVGDRLGGHFVLGHVDETAKITGRKNEGDCLWLQFQVTRDTFKFVITKGSITVNGVSLTINKILRDGFLVEVLLIPETLARTNLSELNVGDDVNVEYDHTVKIIARQIELLRINDELHS